MCMCQLTAREEEVLDKLLRIGNIQITAQELGLKESTIYVMRARVRGKIDQARDFLKQVKKYQRVLGTSQLK